MSKMPRRRPMVTDRENKKPIWKVVTSIIAGTFLVGGVAGFAGFNMGISDMQPEIATLQAELQASQESVDSYSQSLEDMENSYNLKVAEVDDLKNRITELENENEIFQEDYELAILETNVEDFAVDYFLTNAEDLIDDEFNGTEYDREDIKVLEVYDVNAYSIHEDDLKWRTNFKVDVRYGNEDDGYVYTTFDYRLISFKDEAVDYITQL